MFVRKIHLSRRAVLRGIGTTIPLPFLDSMVPALTALSRTAASPMRRLAAVYVPNGMNMEQWRPKGNGPAFEVTPILAPLADVRERITVITGLANNVAVALPGEGGGDHSRGQTAFLTGAHARTTQGADLGAGVSMDQVAARTLGQDTPLPSLELALETNELVGACDIGLACAYSATLVWRDATTPLPMETDPRAVFERLFGGAETTDQRARRARLAQDRSILDAVRSDLKSLQRQLGPRDLTKVNEYVESVRDIEERIRKTERQSATELPSLTRPAGVPESFDAHARLMYDLLVLAYRTETTRVGTFLLGREQSGRTYPEIGVPEPHHGISHHQGRPEALDKLARVNLYHMQLFRYFVDQLAAVPDGDGSLLDHTVVMYGAGFGDSNSHDLLDVPLLALGAGIKGNRHLALPRLTPLANLHLTLLTRMGVPVERFGDSTGGIDL